MSICHRTVKNKRIWNAPLDALMYPLQIINDIEPLSLTIHSVNAWFIHHLSYVKNYSIGHKPETNWPKQKMEFWRIYFYTFMWRHHTSSFYRAPCYVLGFKWQQIISFFWPCGTEPFTGGDASSSKISGSNYNDNQLFSWPQVMHGCRSLSVNGIIPHQ